MPKNKTKKSVVAAKVAPVQMKTWVGFDLGGTKMLAVVMDENYRVLATAKRSTNGTEGVVKGLERIKSTILEALKDAGADAKSVQGIGIGCPGLVDPTKGVLLKAPNLGWKNVALRKRLGDAFRCKVEVINDVDAGTYGEYKLGAGKGARSVLGVFPGTGLGAGFVYDGRLVRGRGISCMELGLLRYPGLGLFADATGTVYLEDLSSRLALATNAALGAFRGQAPELDARAGLSLREVKSKALAASVKAADPATVQVMSNSLRYLGLGVSAVVNLLAPDRVVLGGGLVEEMPQLYLEGLKRNVALFAVPELAKGIRYVKAKLGDRAVAAGAVAYRRPAGVGA